MQNSNVSQALYRKWRPHLWEQVIGQEHIVQTLRNAIRGGRIGHAYLFTGPRGTGKTTTARLLAKAANCLAEDPTQRPCDQCEHCTAVNENRFMDLIEIDAASNTSVDDVRDLREKINFSPSQGQFKVYIIDEVHMLSTAAFNALLKTLEEPPPHAIFILATTEVHKIPATVLSRCQRHDFRRIPVDLIVHHLRNISEQEHVQVTDEVLTLVARQSTGCMRDAISLLDQLASSGEDITLQSALNLLGAATSQTVVDLISAILAREGGQGLTCIHTALDGGTDPRQFARQVVEYLRSLLLIRLGNAKHIDATAEMRTQMAQHAVAFDLPQLTETIRLFNDAAADSRGNWQPGLPLELATAEAACYQAAPVYSQPAPAAEPAAFSYPVQPPPAAQSTIPTAQPAAPAAAPQPVEKAPQPVKTAAVEMPPAAAQVPAGDVSLQTIVQNWARIRSLVKKHRPQTDGLLNSCKPLSLKEGMLTLGFTTEVVKSKMEAGDHLELTRQAIQHLLGIQLQVTCSVMNAHASATPTDLGVESDGMVGTALNLGGKIVHKE